MTITPEPFNEDHPDWGKPVPQQPYLQGPQYGAPGTGYPPPYQPPAQAWDQNGQANAWAGMSPEQAWAAYHHQQQFPQPQQYWQQPPPVNVAQAVTVTVNNNGGSRCPHLLHFILTLITCGMWLPIWIIHAIVDSLR